MKTSSDFQKEIHFLSIDIWEVIKNKLGFKKIIFKDSDSPSIIFGNAKFKFATHIDAKGIYQNDTLIHRFENDDISINLLALIWIENNTQ